MQYELQRISERHDVGKEKFERKIVMQYSFAVARGAVANRPAVREARKSPGAICNYLHAFDNGSDIDAVTVPPKLEPRVAFSDNAFISVSGRANCSTITGCVRIFQNHGQETNSLR